MRHAKRPLLLGVSSIALTGILVATFFLSSGGHAAAAGAGNPPVSFSHLKLLGSTSIQATGAGQGQGNTSLEVDPGIAQLESHDSGPLSGHQASTPTTPPNPEGNGLTNENPGFSGFAGLNHFDTRLAADNGNQFSNEPPDQGLCVGNGFVLEAVNSVLTVYSAETHAQVTGFTSMNRFFKQLSAIVRGKPNVFGPELSDPKCYFDASTNRWFLTTLELDRLTDGTFTGQTHTFIAVSQTGDPTGAFSIFALNTTDDGTNGTPSHAGCPCLGDQPLIGADANGFYISNNEFPVFANGFNGAQLYAISKHALEAAAEANSGVLPTVVQFNVGALPTPDVGGIWGSVQPATAPRLGDEPNNGTEFLLSSLDFFGTLDNRIAAWALTNTRSLNSDNPQLQLSHVVIESEVYGQPPAVAQKPGPTPLRDLIAAVGDPPQPMDLISALNDDRMEQVVFANGLLWSGLTTIVQTEQGAPRMGAAYFAVRPGFSEGHLTANVFKQGYVALDGNNVLYPSVGVNTRGQAVIAFSFFGPDFFPSAGYAVIGADGHAGKVHTAGAGVGPDDGFSGYNSPTLGLASPTPGQGRWGDYSAAVAASDGSIWFANEFIGQTCTDAQFHADTTCGHTRSTLANWDTFISNVTLSGDNK